MSEIFQGDKADREPLTGRREFLTVSVASAVLSLLDGCRKSVPAPSAKKELCQETKDSAVLKVNEKMASPEGNVVYVSPEKGQKYTVIAVKMIHPSKSFPQLNKAILAQYDNIMEIYRKLYVLGVTFYGGEGFDRGEVDGSIIDGKGLANSTYPFIRFEREKGDKVCSLGIDDAEILAKKYELLQKNRPLDALKLNPERTGVMAANIRSYFEKGLARTICITVGGDHIHPSDPELEALLGKDTLLSLLEEEGIRVVVFEPDGYQELLKRTTQLK